MGFFSRHRKAFKSVIASFGMLFGLLAGVSVTANVGYAELNNSLTQLLNVSTKGGTWGLNNDSIDGEVTGTKFLIEYPKSATLNFENICGNPVELSFDWSAIVPSSKGSVTVVGEKYTTSQNLSTKKIDRLEPNSPVSIKLEAKGEHTTKIQISKITAVVIKESTITFKKANFGHYYVNDVLVDDGFQQPGKQLSTTAYTLKAKPDIGYDFIGWQTTIGNTSKIVSIDNPYDFKSADDCEVTAVFKEGQNHAIFSSDSRYFGDLGEAIEHAASSDKIVRLFKSGNVMPRNDGTSYDLSNGVNLFIPGSNTSNYYDFAKKEPPIQESNQTRTCSYTLTLSSGVRINVSKGSSICIAGQMWYATGGNLTSLPVGPVGELNLSDGSIITLASGACFYAWGYASGSGQIHALSGSQVYEGFCFSFRGGDASTSMKPVFVFNQYYVQNIEAHLYVYAGATEKTIAAVQALRGLVKKSTDITFIGADGMFALDSGYVVKYYNPVTDRLSLDVYGDGRLSRIKVSLGGSIFDIDSAEYLLPICNNMDISISSGTVSVEQDLDFLPGSSLTVKTGAVAALGSGRKIFFYDLSNWKGKKYGFINADIQPISYVSPSATSAFNKAKRTVSTGAVLKLNGEFKNSGGVYMTKPNVDTQSPLELGRIISDGGGKFTFVTQYYQSEQDVNEVTSQYDQGYDKNNDNKADGMVFTISAKTAVFMNSDESTFSGVCPAGTALVYENGFWKVQHQGPYEITITFKGTDGTKVIGTKKYTIDGSGIELPDQTGFAGFQGSIFLWREESDMTRSYEPNTNIKTIRDSTTLIAFTGGWYTDINKDTFYYDRSTGKIKGLHYIFEEGDWPEDLYCFDADGRLLTGKGDFFIYESGTKYNGGGDGNVYYVDNGVVQNNVGLAGYDAVVGEVAARYYYYFGSSHYAYRNTTCYINTNLNNLLPAGVYTFGNDGRVKVLECSNFAEVDSVTLSADGYCTFGTIKVGIGLFTSGTHVYYAKDDGSIMRDGTYYVEEGKLNGKATKAGLYYFDTNGYLCDSMMNPITVTPPEANA